MLVVVAIWIGGIVSLAGEQSIGLQDLCGCIRKPMTCISETEMPCFLWYLAYSKSERLMIEHRLLLCTT
jgi:hypothetical protein